LFNVLDIMYFFTSSLNFKKDISGEFSLKLEKVKPISYFLNEMYFSCLFFFVEQDTKFDPCSCIPLDT